MIGLGTELFLGRHSQRKKNISFFCGLVLLIQNKESWRCFSTGLIFPAGSDASVTSTGSVEELLPVTFSVSHSSLAYEDTSTVLNTLYEGFITLYWKLPLVTSTVLSINITIHWQEHKILGPDTETMAILVAITYHIPPSGHNAHCTEGNLHTYLP